MPNFWLINCPSNSNSAPSILQSLLLFEAGCLKKQSKTKQKKTFLNSGHYRKHLCIFTLLYSFVSFAGTNIYDTFNKCLFNG